MATAAGALPASPLPQPLAAGATRLTKHAAAGGAGDVVRVGEGADGVGLEIGRHGCAVDDRHDLIVAEACWALQKSAEELRIRTARGYASNALHMTAWHDSVAWQQAAAVHGKPGKQGWLPRSVSQSFSQGHSSVYGPWGQ